MRICIVLPAHWEAIMGGSQYQAKLLLEALVADGHEVYYLARTIKADFVPDGYQIRVIQGHRFSRVFDSYDLYKQLKELDPDVIYQRVGCAYTGVCAYFAKRHKKPMVWHLASDMDVGQGVVRSRNPFNHFEQMMVNYGRKNATHIVAQTKDQAELLLQRYGRQVDKLIPNFQPVPPDTQRDSDKQELKIIWIGNFKPVKQPELFVQLAKDLQELENLKFIMVGRPYPDHNKQVEIQNKISDTANLEYLGGLSIEQVNTLLEKADLLINTSTVEGFSNTFIQAWMRGVPVLSLSVNPDKILSDPNLGRFANGNYQNLVRLVEELVNSPMKRVGLAANVQTYASTHHSLANISALKKVLEV